MKYSINLFIYAAYGYKWNVDDGYIAMKVLSNPPR